MKNLFALALFAVVATAQAGEMENLLAKAISSPELDAELKVLNTTRVAKDYRGWGKFEFMSAGVGGTYFSGNDTDYESTQSFYLVYENQYETAQRATIEVIVGKKKVAGKSLPEKITVETKSVEETGGPILK